MCSRQAHTPAVQGVVVRSAELVNRRGDIVIAPARREQVDLAASILEDAIARALARAFETWAPGEFSTPGARGRRRLATAAEEDALYVAWLGGDPVATFTLLDADPEYWPDAPVDALYVHRLAVRTPGRAIGHVILDWCKHEVVARGRRYLRLDCLMDDAKLRRYYEEAGFEWRRNVDVSGRRLSLLEARCDAAPGSE